MTQPNKKTKSIHVSEKNPFVISSSPKGLIVGKYMSNYLNAKPTPTQKMFLETEARLKVLGKQLRNIQRNQTKENSHGQKVMIDFFREATNYTELRWKILQEKLSKKGANKEKIMQDIEQAELDFNYFWERHRELIKPKNEPKNPLKIAVQKAEQKLNKSREELKKIQKEYGAGSWQSRKILLEHLLNFKQYLYHEADYLNALIRQSPSLTKEIKANLNTIESNFKTLAKRIAYLRETL